MIAEEKINIPKLQGHHCFACGTANPIGLNLEFYRLDDAVCSEITLGNNYEGWQNISHGGIISTLLDELMSWTIIYFKRIFFLTRKMEVKYIRPVLIGTPLTIKGRLIDDSEHPKIKAKAEIVDDQDNILARSIGEFIVLPKEKLTSIPEDLKKEMLLLFDRLSEP